MVMMMILRIVMVTVLIGTLSNDHGDGNANDK